MSDYKIKQPTVTIPFCGALGLKFYFSRKEDPANARGGCPGKRKFNPRLYQRGWVGIYISHIPPFQGPFAKSSQWNLVKWTHKPSIGIYFLNMTFIAVDVSKTWHSFIHSFIHLSKNDNILCARKWWYCTEWNRQGCCLYRANRWAEKIDSKQDITQIIN